jgi:hypothetical protein
MITLKTFVIKAYIIAKEYDGITCDGEPYYGTITLKFENGLPVKDGYFKAEHTFKETDDLSSMSR